MPVHTVEPFSPPPPAPAGTSVLGLLKRSFRHRNYRLFFVGQLVSLIGTWMQNVAQSWLVYRLTGSAELLGWVGFANQIPVLFLSPFGGAVADRYPRHAVLLLTQTASMLLACLLGILTLSGTIHILEVFVVASLLGIVNAFDIPVRQSFIVELVSREDLPNAIALNSSMFNGARIVGPALAGLTIAVVGEGWCFVLNAASFLAVLLALLAMRLTPHPRPVANKSVLGDMVEGLGYVWRTAPIRSLLGLLGLSSLTGMSYSVVMPVFAHTVLKGGPMTLGLLMSAAGLGALLAGLTLATRRSFKGFSVWIANGTLGFGISLILFAGSPYMWLSLGLLVIVGYTTMIQMAASNTLIQCLVPDAYRGRTMAVYSMVFVGIAPFGALLAGVIADRLGAPVAVAFGGAACVVGALLFRYKLPVFREATRKILDAQTTPKDNN